MNTIPDNQTGASRPVKRPAYFNLPPELKETILRLAEIRYEEKRQDPFSDKDESYFKKMKNRLICDYCNDIAAHTGEEELQKLSLEKEAQLEQLSKLRQNSTSKQQSNNINRQFHSYNRTPLTHFEPVTGVPHTAEGVQKAFQKRLDR